MRIVEKRILQAANWVIILGVFRLVRLTYLKQRDPITIYTDPYPVLEQTVKRGEEVHFITKYCKHMNITAHMDKYIANGERHRISTYNSSTPKQEGCTEETAPEVVISQIVPMNIPHGKYRIEVDISYPVLPRKTITRTYVSEEFVVF